MQGMKEGGRRGLATRFSLQQAHRGEAEQQTACGGGGEEGEADGRRDGREGGGSVVAADFVGDFRLLEEVADAGAVQGWKGDGDLN